MIPIFDVSSPRGALTLTLLVAALLTIAGSIGLAEPESTLPPPVEVNSGIRGINSEQPSDFYTYRLPVGTPLAVVLQSPIGSAVSQVGDPVEAAITQDFYIGSHIMISKKARLKGAVSFLELPIQGRNALMGVAFNQLLLQNGERIPIDSYIKTERPDHLWGGQLTPGTEFKRVTHRVLGLGTYNKTVLAGEREMGRHLQFLPGEHLRVILTRPITVVVPKSL